jgi:NADH-quinone oxidoreductase subunit J
VGGATVIAALFQPSRVTATLATGSDVGLEWSGPQIVFCIVAALTILGAISTVTRRNAIAAVMSLVATFFGLAALYAMLSAHFIAVLQVLVYAGAIMTLFVFVVMVLNRDESEPWAWSGVLTKGVGVFALVYLVTKIGYHLIAVSPARAEQPPADFGTVEQVGTILFTDYLFVFEAVSVLLLIAVIAAVVVAKTRHTPDEPTPLAPETPETSHSAAQSGGTTPISNGDHA